jgi:hypothetical protein
MKLSAYKIIAVYLLKIILMPMLALAQQIPGQWAEELYLVQTMKPPSMPSYAFIDENNVIRITIPSVSNAVDFPVPHESRVYASISFWHRDALYSPASGWREANETGLEVRRWTFAKWKDDKWHFLGEYTVVGSGVIKAIPCDNDRFIVISDKTDLTGNKGPDRSPFVRMSIPEGKTYLKIDTSIAHGVDGIDMSAPSGFSLAFKSKIIKTDKHAVLVNCDTGLYWIFSLESASLTRSGQIFDKVTPEMIAKGGFNEAVLCVNPEKDGTILISTQAEEAFTTETGNVLKEAGDYLRQNQVKMDGLREVFDMMNNRMKELADRSPFIDWYRIHPESGKVEKRVLAPMGAASVRDDGKNDLWRPMPDGSVKMGAPQYTEDAPKKAEPKAEEENKKEAESADNKIR